MRDLTELNCHRMRGRRVTDLWGSEGGSEWGAFTIKSPVDAADMLVIAASGDGWDHVSVSRQRRMPNWQEMEHVKRLFFLDDEVAMQLHVPSKDHINIHPNCLHLWRPQGLAIPLPPKVFV